MAVIAALVLIALAVFVRGLLVDDDASGSGSNEKKGRKGEAPVVACTPELKAVCDALADEGEIADDPPELDLDGATDPDADIDGWITWNPAPQIANFAAGQNPVWAEPTVLGSAVEAVLIDDSAAADLPGACRSRPTWTCLADAAPGLSIGVGDPATAEGIARLAPFARTFTTDDDYRDLDTDGLVELISSPPDDQTDARDMADRLTTRPGSLSMTSGPNDLLLAQTRTSQGQQRGLRILTPTPQVRLVAVVTERVGREGSTDDLVCNPEPPDALAEPLVARGLQPCEGTADAALAGFLFQVQKKVG